MSQVTVGDRVYSRRHKGEIVIVQARLAGYVGVKVLKDGSPGRQEVVIYKNELTSVRLCLPGCEAMARL